VGFTDNRAVRRRERDNVVVVDGVDDNYTDDEIADLSVDTIRDIIRGKLPSGTSAHHLN
jgi:hypothetical protein